MSNIIVWLIFKRLFLSAHRVSWCFTPSQPVWLYQGETPAHARNKRKMRWSGSWNVHTSSVNGFKKKKNHFLFFFLFVSKFCLSRQDCCNRLSILGPICSRLTILYADLILWRLLLLSQSKHCFPFSSSFFPFPPSVTLLDCWCVCVTLRMCMMYFTCHSCFKRDVGAVEHLIKAQQLGP